MDRNRFNGIFGLPYSGFGRQSPLTTVASDKLSHANNINNNNNNPLISRTLNRPDDDYHFVRHYATSPTYHHSTIQHSASSYQQSSYQYNHHSPLSTRPHSTAGSPISVAGNGQNFAHEHNPALSSGHSEIAQWLRFQPLSILQLDPADRVVLFIAVMNGQPIVERMHSPSDRLHIDNSTIDALFWLVSPERLYNLTLNVVTATTTTPPSSSYYHNSSSASSPSRRTLTTILVIAIAARIMWKFIRHAGDDDDVVAGVRLRSRANRQQNQQNMTLSHDDDNSDNNNDNNNNNENHKDKNKDTDGNDKNNNIKNLINFNIKYPDFSSPSTSLKSSQTIKVHNRLENKDSLKFSDNGLSLSDKVGKFAKFCDSSLPDSASFSSSPSSSSHLPFSNVLRSNSKLHDERDSIQKKTFTKWVNKHLIKVTKGVVDLFTDLRDGNNLISLLEVLSGEQIPREKGKMRVHHMQNVQQCLRFLVENRRIKLINIRADDIVDGNPKLTLGLIWTIILHFQLSDIIILDDSMSFKEALLRWAQKTTEGYPDVNVKDFTHSWRDGLAFNAIIHRNRPDLLDYRSCKSRTARQNLEHVFNVCERDLAVTRLLDPEDVDCPNPDEKSLITYISSLYELFPEPPENNPLLDNERIKQIEGYKKLAENLVQWMRKSTKWLNERKFPHSLKEMKRIQEETHRFRAEEIPPHFNDKQMLVNSYKDILNMALQLPIRIEDEYKPESLESQWRVMLQAYQERDRAIHEHMTKLKDLDSVAEKLRRNIKECDRHLDEIQVKVFEEQKRVLKCNPLEPNPRVEEIERELKYEEERIEMMMRDAKYLVECEYPTGQELYQAVLNLQDKHNSISLDFKTKVLDVIEARRAAALKRPLTEAELIASNDMFRFLHECIQWCLEQQKKMAALEYGHDKASVQKFIDEHKVKMMEIQQFQSRVDRCEMNKNEFDGEVLEVYLRMLQRLHKAYTELKTMSRDREQALDSLLELLKEIEREVKWTEDVIAPEIVRDWSAPELSIQQVDEDHRKLHYEIKSHDSQLEGIVNKAERMLRSNHPAVQTITKAVNWLNFKKKLLFEMFNSLDEHKNNANNYHQFYTDVANLFKWIDRAQHQLNTTFSTQNVTLEEGEALQKELLKLKELINEQRRLINDLDTRSKGVCPLKMRTSSQAKNMKVSSLVKIHSDYLKLSKGEQLTLKDNYDAFAWKVQTIGGETISAPNLCFLMPPPDKDAMHKFAELRKQYEDLIGLWAQKNHELRQNMLLATIRNLKNWDYPTYCSKDPAQRDAILNALENDINSVVAESPPGDHKSQRLLDEFDDLKKKFAEYEARRRAELEAKELEKLLKAFVDSITDLLNKLREHEKIITRKLQEPIQRRLEDVMNAIREHESFESETRRFEPAVKRAMAEYAKLPKSPITQSTYDSLMDCWKKIQTNSEKYQERLQALKVVLKDIEDATKLVMKYEAQLLSAQEMPASVEEAKSLFEQFKSLHNDIQGRSANFDKLLSNVSKIRRLVERSRLQSTSNTDIDQLENDMKSLHKRFDSCSVQSLERVKALENCLDLLRNYRNKIERESSWIKQADKRCDEALRRRDLRDAKQLYDECSSHKATIEECNSIGKRFMSEAKTYDNKLKVYRESVEQYHRSAGLQRSKSVSGIDIVTNEINKLNGEYQALVEKILDVLRQLQDDEEKLKEFRELTSGLEQMTAAAHELVNESYTQSTNLEDLSSNNDKYMHVKVEHKIQEANGTLVNDTTELIVERIENLNGGENREIIVRKSSLVSIDSHYTTNIPIQFDTVQKRYSEESIQTVSDVHDSTTMTEFEYSGDQLNVFPKPNYCVVNSEELPTDNTQLLKPDVIEFEKLQDSFVQDDRQMGKMFDSSLKQHSGQICEEFSINFDESTYENVTKKQKMKIEDSICEKLIDFKLNVDGKTYLLSEKLDSETKLIKLPNFKPMSFEQLKECDFFKSENLAIFEPESGRTIELREIPFRTTIATSSTESAPTKDSSVSAFDPTLPSLSAAVGSTIKDPYSQASQMIPHPSIHELYDPILIDNANVTKMKEELPKIVTFKRVQDTDFEVVTIDPSENEISKRLFEWLTQKERLIQDFGPICSEPKMLGTQLQQIQTMKDDFNSQTANLNKMDMLADSLLERLDASNPNVRPIKSRRDDIHSKWDSLKKALDDRERNLLNVKDAAADFQAKYEKLIAALQKIGDDFERIVNSGADNEEQLLKLSSLEDSLDGLRPAIADCELSCEKLCDLLTDAASKNEVRNKVGALRKLYEDLAKKISDKKAELQNFIKEDKDFYYDCDAVQDWLRNMQMRLNKDSRVSAILEKVQRQVIDFEPTYQEVLQKEHEIYILLQKAQQLQKRLTRPADISQLKSKVDSVKKQWDSLKTEATNHHTKLQKCLDIATKYNNALNNFLPWLKQMEDKLKQTSDMLLQKQQLEKLLREFQMHKSEISRHVSEFENVCNLGEALINSADIDTEVIRDQLNEVKRRWNDLQNDLNNALEEFEKLLAKLGGYNDKARDLNHGLNRLSDKLGNLDSKDPKQLDKLKGMLDESKALADQLDDLKKVGFNLIDEAGPKFDSTPIRDELAGFDDKMNDLAKRLADAHGGLEKASKYLNKFNQDLSEIERKLRSLEEKLDQMAPVGRTVSVVEAQLEEMEDFNQKLRDVKADLNDAERQAEDLINKGYTTDPSGVRSAVNNLNRKYERIDERAKSRTDALKDALDKLKNFQRQVKENMADIRDVLAELESFKPISRELDAIKQQQREFQNFTRTRVDPLGEKVAAVTKLGNDLIQSAPNGVNTSELERELEKHSDSWNNLKDKVNDRERKLDLALLQAGKFKDALNSVEKWLSETEEMVANQKPPSSDYIALRAQLQEQKYLKKMLTERESSIDALEEIGKDFMANLDRPEREQIEKQLANIRKRFNNLVDNCDKRMKILENSLSVAKEFADRIAPLQEWLENAIRRLNQLQSFSIDEDKLQKRIGEHKQFHNEVMGKQRDFNDLAKCAQKLIGLIQNDEEERLVNAKLSDITDKYGKLCKDSDDLGKLLADTFDEMSKFLSQMNKLNQWLADTDSKLNQYKVLSIQWDALKKQHNELEGICNDINNKQGDISDFISHGQSLLKRFASNDSYFIRQKLDNIQSKYNDLKQRAVDKLDYCKAALNLAEKFYKAHDILNKWLDDSEKELENMDSLSIYAQNEIVTRIEGEVPTKRRVLDSVNNLGTEFARTSPGTGSSTIQGMVSKCNRRFQAIVDMLQRKSEKLRALMEQNKALGNELDELMAWFRDAERKLLDAEPIVPSYDVLMRLLKETKKLNEEINNQKGRVRDVISNVKRLLRDAGNDEINAMNNKAEELKELANHVSQLCQDRLNAIEEALPLVENFYTAHNEIVQFLDEAEAEAQMLAEPSVYPDAIRKQQEAVRRLIQSLNAQKPLFERLNKSGTDLMKLLQKHDARTIQNIMDDDNDRYNKLRNMLREHQNVLEAALQNTAQFADKLDGMLAALSGIYDQLKNADPISGFVEKLLEQISDNRSIMDDLKQKEPQYNAVKSQAKEVISKAGRADEPAIRDIRNKLDKLNNFWNDCHKMANDRNANLEEALRLAKQFWNELGNVMRSIQELEDSLLSQEPAGVEPAKIEEQQKILKAIRREMDKTAPEVEQCKKSGKKLLKVCGEPDKPEIKKNLDELENAWDNVTALYAKREKSLIDAMGKAMDFHEKMKSLQNFLDEAEDRFKRLGPIAADIDAVKRQIVDLKNFKNFVDPHMADIEQLNRMAGELLEDVPPNQGRGIRDAVKNINSRWNDLNKAISDRQSDLDKALLQLGQFQHALNELLAWIAKMEKNLADNEPIYADPQIIEVEISKHKVIMNDIHAHQANVDQLNMVGKQLIDSEFGSESARSNRRKLDDLNNRWAALIQRAQDRSEMLDDCLRTSQNLAQEIQDMLSWLNEIDSQISTSKPVGGLPETAREQLNRFMEVYNELDKMRHKVESLLQNGENYVSKAREGAAQHLTHNLKVLRSKWENILARANDRKIKLEIALKEATEFHEALQNFVDWLTKAENYLKNLSPVSRVVDHVLKQIEEHKNFQKDVSAHREVILDLDKKGTHLKYFSQKQDVTIIKNLLSSVQNRWDNVLAKTAERARALDHGFKEAKEFYDMWSDLIGWLEDAEKDLDAIVQLGNNPDLIKQTLARHKEFQRQLGAKQTQYDHTMRYGKGLKDKAPNVDHPILQDMLDELKNKWNAVCQKSVDKQRKLEEALLFSGQFKDAIQALIEWLEKAKHLLGYDQPVHGDLDTVNSLFDAHKSFIKDYHSRETSLKYVRKTAADLVKSAQPDDARHIQSQIETLNEKWNEIEHLIKQKESRLNEALKEAEKLHDQVHAFLKWLSEAESKLRFSGPLPEDEATTRSLIQEHERFKQEMKSQERCKAAALDLTQVILDKCHPNALPSLKHFKVIIQARWDEVESWAAQREKRLNNRLKSLMDTSDLMEDLFKWANEIERDLSTSEQQPLPDDVLELEKLIEKHQRLIDDVNDKRIDIDRVVKEYSVKKPSEKSGRSRMPSGRSVKSDASMGLGETLSGDLRNPKAKELNTKFNNICKLSMERLKKLKDNLEFNRQAERNPNFDFNDWRRRFLFKMQNKKANISDFYGRLDTDNDNRISKSEFIEGVLASDFNTNRAEMEKVADTLDLNGDGSIDVDEFMNTLRPEKEGQSKTESEIIQDEVKRQVGQCTCAEPYPVNHVGEGKFIFGNTQKLRLVRILRSNVMVRVGGGWVSLNEFLEKNDPCRARGRTNMELREQFTLADGVSQSMSPFKSKSPFRSDGSISTTGPISKIREKTDRSIPMSQGGYRYGSSGNESSDHEADLYRRPHSRLTPSNSRPGSRVGSQPPSRNASDMSTESLEAYRRRPGSGLRSKSGSQTGLSSVPPRTPSFNLGQSSTSNTNRWKY